MWLNIALVSVLAPPAFVQDKETDRVENAGKVMKEILNAPDSIPKSVRVRFFRTLREKSSTDRSVQLHRTEHQA
jgi:hypothetical protein